MSNATEIAKLEAILNAGANDVTVDGIRTVYNFEEIRRRLAILRRQDDADARPRVASADLSGF